VPPTTSERNPRAIAIASSAGSVAGSPLECFWIRAKSFTSSNMSRFELDETPSVPRPIETPALSACG
jgi:hypothetical protein